MRRESHGSVQIHWLKFEALMNRLDLPNHALSADLVFMRALKSHTTQPTQRAKLLMSLDAQGLGQTYPNLKKCTVRLFGLYKDTSSNVRVGERDNAQSFPPDADVLNIEENDDEHICMVRKQKTTRNRPSMEQLAIKKSGTTMNIENGIFFGKGIHRYRCGKRDHVLRECPLPYKKTLAFAPTKEKGESPEKPIHLTEDDVAEQLDIDENSIGSPEEAENSAITQSEGSPPEVEEETRMSNWFRSEFAAYMAWSSIEDPSVAYDATFQESSATNEKSKVIQNAPILDSGA